MQDAGYAALQIIPSFKGFQPALEHGSSGAMIAAGSSGGRKYGDAAGRSMASAFASHARRAAFLAAGGLAVVGAGLFKLGKDSLAEAREAQKVGALTTQVIKSTGGAANITAREVGNLSNTLSLKTGVDDEVIQRGANMLLTFKNIRNEVGLGNDVFNQSVQVTEDMAASMAGGMGGGQLDLKSSSILVGKALNDPIKGVTALTRVGVSFTDQQKKTIESLEKQGKASAAQNIVLKELKSEFGGAAEAQATMGEKVDVAWGNIQERLGTAILPLVHDVQRAILNDAVPALNRFADWFQHDGVPAIRHFANDAKPQIRGFIEQTKPLAEELIPAVSSALGDVRDVAHDALPYVKDLIGAFNDMPDWAKKGVALGGLGALAGKKLGVGSLLFGGSGSSGGILGGFSAAKPLPVFVVNDSPIGTPGSGGKGGYGKYLALGVAEVATAVIGTKLATDSQGSRGVPGVNSGGSGSGVTPGKNLNALPDVGPSKPFWQWDWNPFDNDHAGKWVDNAAKMSDSTKMLITGTGQLGLTMDKVPKKLETNYSAPGITDGRAKNSTQQLIEILTTASKPRQGRFTIDTAQAAAALNHIIDLQNAVASKRAAMQAAGVLPGGGGSSSGGGKSTSPDRPRGRTALHVHIGDREIVTLMDERVYSERELDEERQRAGAGR